MPIIQNIAEHDFSFPVNQGPEDIKQRDGESREKMEARLAKQEIRIPKKRHEHGDEGEPGYDPGGPGQVTVTDAELAMLRSHRVSRNWFGVNLAKGQGLVVAEDQDDPKKDEAPKKGKAA